jgi:hypothetical protein
MCPACHVVGEPSRYEKVQEHGLEVLGELGRWIDEYKYLVEKRRACRNCIWYGKEI